MMGWFLGLILILGGLLVGFFGLKFIKLATGLLAGIWFGFALGAAVSALIGGVWGFIGGAIAFVVIFVLGMMLHRLIISLFGGFFLAEIITSHFNIYEVVPQLTGATATPLMNTSLTANALYLILGLILSLIIYVIFRWVASAGIALVGSLLVYYGLLAMAPFWLALIIAIAVFILAYKHNVKEESKKKT